jgi:hypothetical protein
VNSRDRRPCLRMRARSCTTANAVARCCGRTWATAASIARTDRFPVHRSSGSVSGAPLVLDPTRVTDAASQTILRSRFEANREAYDKGRRSIHSYGLRVKNWGTLGGPSARYGWTQTRSQRCQAPPGCWSCGTSDAAARCSCRDSFPSAEFILAAAPERSDGPSVRMTAGKDDRKRWPDY